MSEIRNKFGRDSWVNIKIETFKNTYAKCLKRQNNLGMSRGRIMKLNPPGQIMCNKNQKYKSKAKIIFDFNLYF